MVICHFLLCIIIFDETSVDYEILASRPTVGRCVFITQASAVYAVANFAIVLR